MSLRNHPQKFSSFSNELQLRNFCPHVLVVAHRENTAPLLSFLKTEGFSVEEFRGPYSAEQEGYSAIMRCLVNHANAWKVAVDRKQPTMIVEADFVPVCGFGSLPIPLPPERYQTGLAYLYGASPTIWDLALPYVARGHAGATVAYVLSPQIAKLLLEFFVTEIAANPQGIYTPFDTRLGYWLLTRGIESYFPYRHYGEHGGLGNSEHRGVALRSTHRADVVWGSLAFSPMYAKKGSLTFWFMRVFARVWGAIRLSTGRLMPREDLCRGPIVPLLRFALGRLIWRRPPR